MLTPKAYREIVSGRRGGLFAAAARGLFRMAEVPYAFAVRRRNAAFDRGSRPSHVAAVPVVSVGNLTLGGTGKTPLVHWVVRYFHERGVRVAIVSRGYGARSDATNDEARELAEKLPGVPHVQNPDRVAAAAEAVEHFGCQLIVLDDGFQHRRLARHFDIVVIDALEPFGFDHVFPRGTLREPVEGLRRAAAVVLSRSDLVDDQTKGEIRRRVETLVPRVTWAECRHAPKRLRSAIGGTSDLSEFSGVRVAAFSGIGNPDAFRATLEQCGCRIVGWREFADHHRYEGADLVGLERLAKDSDAAMLVCTHKDLVKLSVDRLGEIPLLAVEVEIEFTDGEERLRSRLEPLVEVALGVR